jgi:hypothetical protein
MHVLSIFTVYAFIFVISAYGIVWYGIAVYALMFFLSVLALITINTVDKLKEDTGTTVRFIGSVVLLVMMSIYFFSSSFPHGFNNLQGAGF